MAIHCNRCVFHPNDCINGQYTIVRMLGAGSFGCVYHVRDYKGQDFALKLLKLWEIVGDDREQLLQRFDMEYETGRIKSNYLVHSYDKGSVEGNPFIVMEYCPCGDLMSAAEKGNVDFVRVAREILYGLRDLHLQGKVHRDLKPENVLIRQDGTAILTDFGISGDRNNRLTQRGILGIPQQIFGTFAYMPPEQISPKRGNATVLPTTDIFSFGVMMYQLLTCELPFGNLQSEADLPQYTERGKRGKWNRDLLEKTDSGHMWLRLIEGCLVPDFKKRLQSVDEVLALLPSSVGRTYKPVDSESFKKRSTLKNGVLLRIMQGEEYNKEYILDSLLKGNSRILTIGRDTEDVFNSIPIKETLSSYISRCHCTLELDCERGTWVLRDGQWRIDCPIGLRFNDMFPCKVCTARCPNMQSGRHNWKLSMNGTYVNSTEVDRSGISLKLGDIITIGDVKLRVEGY